MRHSVGEGPGLKRFDDLAQVRIAVDPSVGLSGQLIGIEEILLIEPALHPSVEARAEARRRRGRPGHRPHDVSRETIRVAAQSGQRRGRQTRRHGDIDDRGSLPLGLGEESRDLVIPLVDQRRLDDVQQLVVNVRVLPSARGAHPLGRIEAPERFGRALRDGPGHVAV